MFLFYLLKLSPGCDNCYCCLNKMYCYQPKQPNQSQEEGLGAVTQPHVLTAKSANGTRNNLPLNENHLSAVISSNANQP